MKRIEGVVSRFFYNPVKNTAMFRMQGKEQVRFINVPEHWGDCDGFVMTRPGDEVAVDIEPDDLLEGWFNATFLMNLK